MTLFYPSIDHAQRGRAGGNLSERSPGPHRRLSRRGPTCYRISSQQSDPTEISASSCVLGSGGKGSTPSISSLGELGRWRGSDAPRLTGIMRPGGTTGIRCPGCQHENPGEARCCLQCGSALVLRCETHDRERRAGTRFCIDCGRRAGCLSRSAATPSQPPKSLRSHRVRADRAPCSPRHFLCPSRRAPVAIR